ncbi:MAG: response regulator transcription factor [Pedobacter sp.]|uniref:response regulator transcription factor n=1 Tax=Pedobacter sp. TaxID=1411316 RepID=UPI00280947F1|nr:response regulator transcription factor [Pedobacter sp.]MDQ8003458.1 response regulator transcription factor [Pedobacter sp.]
MIKIAIADDHQLILNGLKAILNESTEIDIIFTVTNGQQLLQQLEIEVPKLLLLDIELPDSNGIDLCKAVKDKYPDIKIIALTNHEETVYVRKMMKSGADGYLLKGTDQVTLIKAITTVAKGEQFIDESIKKNILQETISGKKSASLLKLTKRENEILSLIANEYSNQEIADKLFLSIRTVESHRLSLSQKLNVKNTVGLVKEAYLRGLIK